MSLTSIWKRYRSENPHETYSVRVLSYPQELEHEDSLPLELQYIREKNPALFTELKILLSGGKAIGIRTIKISPQKCAARRERIVCAVPAPHDSDLAPANALEPARTAYF
ncbi:MAG: hypothetical protein WC659_06195 [Patescibacteria group bacterium]